MEAYREGGVFRISWGKGSFSHPSGYLGGDFQSFGHLLLLYLGDKDTDRLIFFEISREIGPLKLSLCFTGGMGKQFARVLETPPSFRLRLVHHFSFPGHFTIDTCPCQALSSLFLNYFNEGNSQLLTEIGFS
jgi:hypothetical protein